MKKNVHRGILCNGPKQTVPTIEKTNLTNSYNDFDKATKMNILKIQNIQMYFRNVMLSIISQ